MPTDLATIIRSRPTDTLGQLLESARGEYRETTGTEAPSDLVALAHLATLLDKAERQEEVGEGAWAP